jgi:hypothetical protein
MAWYHPIPTNKKKKKRTMDHRGRVRDNLATVVVFNMEARSSVVLVVPRLGAPQPTSTTSACPSLAKQSDDPEIVREDAANGERARDTNAVTAVLDNMVATAIMSRESEGATIIRRRSRVSGSWFEGTVRHSMGTTP